MRNLAIAGLLLALLGAGGTYFYSSPRLALAEIREAAKSNDTEKLAERVDFPKLRQGVKEQLNALVQGKIARDFHDNPFAAIGAAMATAAVDSLVDTYVSPAAIGALAGGLSPRPANGKPWRQPESAPAQSSVADAGHSDAAPDRPKPKADKASVEFDALDQASAYVTGKRGEKVRFVLRLDGWRWRLTNIVLPPELAAG